jgi:WD40 repeat protein
MNKKTVQRMMRLSSAPPCRPGKSFSRRQLIRAGVGASSLALASTFAGIPSAHAASSTTAYLYTRMGWGIYQIDWSPDGSRVVTAGESNPQSGLPPLYYAETWDALTGLNPVRLTAVSPTSDPLFVYSARWSPDGTRIVSGCSSKFSLVWDASSGEILTTHQSPIDLVVRAEWSPDGNTIATSGYPTKSAPSYTVELWRPTTGDTVLTYAGHISNVITFAWSPNGTRIASVGGDYYGVDNTIHVWNTRTGELELQYTAQPDVTRAIAWSPDGSRIASGGDETTVHIWDSQTGQPLHILHGHVNSVSAIDWSPDGTLVASASGDRSVHIWNPDTARSLYAFYGNGAIGSVRDVSWSPDGHYIASCTLTQSNLPSGDTASIWHPIL